MSVKKFTLKPISLIFGLVFLISLLNLQYSFAKEIVHREALEDYATKLIEDGYNILQKENLSPKERKVKISRLIKNSMNLEWMASYTLGRARKRLSEAKIKEFTQVYSDFVVQVYSDLSSHYNGQKANVKKVKEIDDNMFIINLEIISSSSERPVKIDYLVQNVSKIRSKPDFKIADIITEGISVLNSQQSEFKAVIHDKGIDELIENLKAKISHPEVVEKHKANNRV